MPISVSGNAFKFTDNGYGRAQTLDAYVCTPDRQIKCRIRGIKTFDVTAKGFNDLSTISFTVSKYVTNASDYQSEVNDSYDYLHAFCPIFVPAFEKFGYFIINTEPNIDARGSLDETKSFSVESYESVLQFENLVGFAVNQGVTGSLEMYEENLDDMGIPQQTIQLYNPENPKLSLLDLALTDDYFGWSVGHVDETIKTLRRSFNVDNQNVYSFLCYDVSRAFRCIFVFDTFNKTINCYDVESAGENTNIYLSLSHFLSEIQIGPQNQDIYTVLNVAGGNGLGIEMVNFGSPKIYDVTYPLSMIDPELLAKYRRYLEIRDQLRQDYADLALEYNNQLQIQQAILDRAPDEAVLNNWTSTVYYPTDELKQILASYQNYVALMEQIYTDHGVVDYDALDLSLEAGTFYSYRDVCIPDIQSELKYRSTKEEYEPIKAETVWKLYGLETLKTKLQIYLDEADNLRRQGYDKTWDPSITTISEETFTAHHARYLEIMGAGGYVDQLRAIIDDMQAKYDESEARLKDILEQMRVLAKQADMGYYIEPDTFYITEDGAVQLSEEEDIIILDNTTSSEGDILFTPEEITLIRSLYRESDYSNQNILITDIDDLVSQVDKAWDLYEDASDRLDIESVPQYTWTINSANLFAMQEFKPLRGQLQVGSFINLYYGGELFDPATETFVDKQTLKFRVIQIDFSGIDFNGNFNIVFATTTTTQTYRNDFESLIGGMISSRTNSITGNAISAAVSTAAATAMSILRPYMEVLNARIAEAEIDKANIINLEAYKAEIQSLTAEYLNANMAEIFSLTVDIIQSDDGNSWWNLRTGDLCLNGFMIDTEVEYAVGPSRVDPPVDGWSTDAPVVTSENPYVWMRTKMTLSGNPPTELYSSAVCITGADGAVTIVDQGVLYRMSESGTSPETISSATESDEIEISEDDEYVFILEQNSDWSEDIPEPTPGMYLWTKSTVEYSDATETNAYSVATSGRGVVDVVNEYYLSSSDSAVSGGDWALTPPVYVPSHYYWSRTHTTYNDGTEIYSEPILDEALNNAIEGKEMAEATNHYFFHDSEGAHVSTVEGDGNAGENVLLNSNGMKVRNGTTELARFGAESQIGADESAHVQITPSATRFANQSGNDVVVINNGTTYARANERRASYDDLYDTNLNIGDTLTVDIEIWDDSIYYYGDYFLKLRTYIDNVNLNSYADFTFETDHSTAIDSGGLFSATITNTEQISEVLYFEDGTSVTIYGLGVTVLLTATQAVTMIPVGGSYGYYDYSYFNLSSSANFIFGSAAETNYPGHNSFIAGVGNTNYGQISAAFGLNTNATGNYSFVCGSNTSALSDNQTVVGKYNEIDNNGRYLFIVGNGSLGRRSNAFAVKSDGGIVIGNNLEVDENTYTATVEPNYSPDVSYGSTWEMNIRKWGKVVEFTFNFDALISRTSTTSITIATIPAGLRPVNAIRRVSLTRDGGLILYVIATNGSVQVSNLTGSAISMTLFRDSFTWII